MEATRSAIDRHVGEKVRFRRQLLGISVERFASLIGAASQEVEKYETGVKRIGASRLHQIATTLDVPLKYFFECAPTAPAASLRVVDASISAESVVRKGSLSDAHELIHAFARVHDPKARRRIIDLTISLAAAEETERLEIGIDG